MVEEDEGDLSKLDLAISRVSKGLSKPDLSISRVSKGLSKPDLES